MKNILTATILLMAATFTAQASTITIVGSGVTDTFTLDSSPQVSSFATDSFTIQNVLINANGGPLITDVTFFDQLLGGGFLLVGTDVNGFGDQLFQGTSSTPVLEAGVYALNGVNSFVVTISDASSASVPEPAALGLLVIGLLAVGLYARSLRAKVRKTRAEA